jgi:hypothetical protein
MKVPVKHPSPQIFLFVRSLKFKFTLLFVVSKPVVKKLKREQ